MQLLVTQQYCIWNICVTLQGIDYKLPDDDTIVSKRIEVMWQFVK